MAEAQTLNTGESATQLQPLELARVTAQLRNRHGRFAFQTHRSGPMLGTTGCTAMPTSTMAGEQTGSQLKSHSPDLQKDCNTNRGVPAGSHDTQVALKCSAVDANKATPSRKTVSTLLFLRSFEGFYALRPLTLATSPSQHPISSLPRPPPPLFLPKNASEDSVHGSSNQRTTPADTKTPAENRSAKTPVQQQRQLSSQHRNTWKGRANCPRQPNCHAGKAGTKCLHVSYVTRCPLFV